MGKIKVTRVVIDTNVAVSALLFGGEPGKLIPLWKRGDILPVASAEIIDEYLRVLAYPKFKLSEKEISFILYAEILPHFEIIRSTKGPVIVKEDPSDDKFVRTAEAGSATTIISGDHHLITLGSHGKIRILTVTRFLEELEDR